MNLVALAALFIGIVRGDGSIVPVASHDGRSWITVSDVPSTFRRVPLDDGEEVAVAWTGDTRPMPVIALSNEEAVRVLTFPGDDVTSAERDAVRDWNKNATGAATYPVTDAEMRAAKPEPQVAVRTKVALDGWNYTFVQALKRYPGRDCPAVVRVQTLIRERQGSTTVSARLTDAEASAGCLPVSLMHPLANFIYQNETYWIVRFTGPLAERNYGIVRVRSLRLERVELKTQP